MGSEGQGHQADVPGPAKMAEGEGPAQQSLAHQSDSPAPPYCLLQHDTVFG